MSDIIDLQFPVVEAQSVPVDHGYFLFASVSRLIPEIHQNESVGLDVFSGRPSGNGRLELWARHSTMTVRAPAELIPRLLILSGNWLSVKGIPIRLGVPTVRPLAAAEALKSRLVTIKGFTDLEEFRQAVNRQLLRLGITSRIEVETGSRRVVRIKDAAVVGFAVLLSNISDGDSLLIQRSGLGGRRRFGCGFFRPAQQEGGAGA